MTAAADPQAVIAAALSWIDTPYHHQASLKGVGCDCLGLARGVWREVVGPEPLEPPPYTRDWGEVSKREVLVEAARQVGMLETPLPDAGPGALILFRMAPGAIAKHCGILIEGGRMVHAVSNKWVMKSAYDSTWSRKAAFAFLYPAAE